ncbi:MAG: hypothetical protein Q8M16_23100 [Pirellulaceae bacterium]|nr:hypothetical protein [Pirellulaceae bacterium]
MDTQRSSGYRDGLGSDPSVSGGNLAAQLVGYSSRCPLLDWVSPAFALNVSMTIWNGVQMILRLSQEMKTKIKAGKLVEIPLDSNPYVDWSFDLFNDGRRDYIIMMNTASFFSCVFSAWRITSVSTLLSPAKETIGGYLADDGKQFVFSKYIAPSFSAGRFAKPLSHSASESMNDLVDVAKTLLAHGMGLHEIAYQLNKAPMSALVGPDGRRNVCPKEAFASLADRIVEK